VARAAVLALALAACGGTAATSSSPPASGGSGSSASADPLASARAQVQLLASQPSGSDIGVTAALTTKPTGKRVVYMQCAIPVCVAVGDLMQHAAQALGITYSRVNTGSSAEDTVKAWTQVASNPPDGVLATGAPTVLYSAQLQQLAAAHVPVVIWAMTEGVGNGIVANLEDSSFFSNAAKLMADWLAVNAGGSAKVLYVDAPEFLVAAPMKATFKTELTASCSSCTVDSIDVKIADVGTQVPSRVVSYLQQHPDVKWVVPAAGDFAIGVPAALQQAGITGVQVVSQSGSPVNYGYIKDGSQAVDVGHPLGMLSYRAIDALARAMTGQPIPTYTPIPRWYITKDNVGSFDATKPWVGPTGFDSAYRKLWGV
jgi:ribose transport system substrate-binding protein